MISKFNRSTRIACRPRQKYQSIPDGRTREQLLMRSDTFQFQAIKTNQIRQLSTVVSNVSDRRSMRGTWEGEAWRTSSVPTRARQVTDRAKVLRALPLNENSIASSPPPSMFRFSPNQSSLMAGVGDRFRARFF